MNKIKTILLILICFISLSFNTTKVDDLMRKNAENIYHQKILNLTKIEIQDYNFTLVKDSAEDTLGYIYASTVNTCRSGGCSNTEKPIISVQNANYENFSYLVFYNKELAIKHINIYDYNATHGYQICSKAWLKQFYDCGNLSLLKHKDIDAISGATISVNAIFNDLQNSYSILLELTKTNSTN